MTRSLDSITDRSVKTDTNAMIAARRTTQANPTLMRRRKSLVRDMESPLDIFSLMFLRICNEFSEQEANEVGSKVNGTAAWKAWEGEETRRRHPDPPRFWS